MWAEISCLCEILVAPEGRYLRKLDRNCANAACSRHCRAGKVNDTNLPHSSERTIGLGAGIQYFSGRQTWIHLNGYKEPDVRNRAQGISVT
jgi:hypothetical protein